MKAVSLGELFLIGSSKRVLKSQWATRGVPFYRGREITRLAEDGYVNNELFIADNVYSDYKKKYGVPAAGDIVITAIGTIGNSYVVQCGDKFYFKDASVLWLHKKTDVSSEFINLWLKSPLFTRQLDRGNGATVDTLTIKKLQSVTVSLPPPAQQEIIVKKLHEAFEAIDKAKENTEKNLKNAQELFESELFTLINSADGEKQSLDNFLTLNYGKALAKSERDVDGKFNVYGANGVKDKSDRYLWDLPSIIVGRKGSAGELNLTEGPFWPLDVTYYVEHDSTKSNLQFIYLLLKTLDLTKMAKGVKPGINRNEVYSIKVNLPDLVDQGKIVKKLESLSEQTQVLLKLYRQKLEGLEELKRTVMKQAFEGEL